MKLGTNGVVLDLTGAQLGTAYVASAPIFIGRAQVARFFIQLKKASSGSSLTGATLKLQGRYFDGTTATAYLDIPSNDVVGTVEIEHALAAPSAGQTADGTFSLDGPTAWTQIIVSAKADAGGAAGDELIVYGEAA